MGFFRLRSLPGMVWPPVPVLELSQLWTAYLELDRTQWLSPEELAERQLEQVRALLLHCFHQVPYYRGLLAHAGIGARPIQGLDDFRRIPLLSREVYQTNFANLQARNLPGGIVQTGVSHSSGTNGVPLKVLSTNQSDLWWTAFFLRDLEWIGFDPRKRLAAIRLVAKSREELPEYLDGEAYDFWTKALVPLLEMGSSYMMDIRQDPNRQLQWLRRIDVDYLLSFPSNLEFLAGLIAESGQRLPNLRAIQAIGETLPAAVRQRIEAGFGVPVQNTYSTTEAGYIASPCPRGHGLHVHAENVLAEVLDADDRPCLPGQTGRLVLTTLHNFLTPFLRYDILDDVTLCPARVPAGAVCPCGRRWKAGAIRCCICRTAGARRYPVFTSSCARWVAAGNFRSVSGPSSTSSCALCPTKPGLRIMPPACAGRCRMNSRRRFALMWKRTSGWNSPRAVS